MKLKFKLLHSCNQQQGHQRLGNLFNVKILFATKVKWILEERNNVKKKSLITMLTNLNKELAESDSGGILLGQKDDYYTFIYETYSKE